MFCTACGTAIPAGQSACPKCGNPAAFANPSLYTQPAPSEPPPAGSSPAASQPFPSAALPNPAMPLQMTFAVERYRSHIKVVAIAWFVWAGLSLLLGFAGLSFARLFWMSDLPFRTHGHIPQAIVPMALHLAWIAILIRAALDIVTGWGLLQYARWGRIFAIFVAIISLFRFPLGTALGIWTLIVLLGNRNAILYEQL